jgi:hypothetical protein
MADFHHRAVAATPVLPWDAERFEAAYRKNREDAQETALEANPTATAILALMEQCPTWTGTAKDLLVALRQVSFDEGDSLPKEPNVLSRRLNRLKSILRNVGIEIDGGGRSGKARTITITRTS